MPSRPLREFDTSELLEPSVNGCWNRCMSTKMTRPIVLACDEGYAMPLGTTLRSIVESNRSSWPIDFRVLFDGFSERIQAKVFNSLPVGSAMIQWIPVNLELFQEFSTLTYISKMTYARFLIPRLFCDLVSRVLYLDTDVLVLDDLAPLWGTDLEGAVLGAVIDGGIDPLMKRDDALVKEVPRVRDYFNAGVLLIDLDRWREKGISEKALDYLARNRDSPFSDQDALNVACDGFWKQLDARWNFHDHQRTRILDIRPDHKPRIVHFLAHIKPWNASDLSLNADFYDAFRSRTRFARTVGDRVQDMFRRWSGRLKAFLRRYAVIRILRSFISVGRT